MVLTTEEDNASYQPVLVSAHGARQALLLYTREIQHELSAHLAGSNHGLLPACQVLLVSGETVYQNLLLSRPATNSGANNSGP